jgi:hypothetical protein
MQLALHQLSVARDFIASADPNIASKSPLGQKVLESKRQRKRAAFFMNEDTLGYL